MDKSAAEIARLFNVDAPRGANVGTEIYSAHPALVIADGQLQSMTWGFPLMLKGRSGQPLKPKAASIARTDKLDNFIWLYSFEERRCLIPLTAFAESEGPKGSETRTWFSPPPTRRFSLLPEFGGIRMNGGRFAQW